MTETYKAARDLEVGDEALIKGEWRRIRGFSKVTDLNFQDIGQIAIVWDPGQRFDNATLDKDELVQVRERGGRSSGSPSAVTMTHVEAEQHPFPHRGVCKYCGSPLSRNGPDDRFMVRSLHGADDECTKAPLQDNGDPGRHVPVHAVSRNGIVPD